MADQSTTLSLIIKAKNEAKAALDATATQLDGVAESAKTSAIETERTQAAIDALGQIAAQSAALMAESYAALGDTTGALADSLEGVRARFDAVGPSATGAGAAAKKAGEDGAAGAAKAARETKTWRDRIDEAATQGRRLLGFFTSIKGLAVGALGLAGVGLSFAALRNEVVALSAELETLDNTARSLSVPVDEFLALDYAARQAGLGSEGLRSALARVQVQAVENADALADLGIRLEGLSATDQLQAIAAALNAIEDPAERVNAATTIFGRELALRVLPLLNDNLDESAARFRSLSGEMISGAIPAARGISSGLTDVATASLALRAELLSTFGPDVQALLSGTAEYIAENRAETVAWAEASVPAGETVVNVVGLVSGGFAGLVKTVELAGKSTVLVLGTLYNETRKLWLLTKQAAGEFLNGDVAKASAEEQRQLDSLKKAQDEYAAALRRRQEVEARGARLTESASPSALEIELKKALFFENAAKGALDRQAKSYDFASSQLSKALGVFEDQGTRDAIAELDAELAALSLNIASSGTISEAAGNGYSFAKKNLEGLLEAARKVRAELGNGSPASGGAATDGLDSIRFTEGPSDRALGPDKAEWEAWRAEQIRSITELRADAMRTLDEATLSNDAASFAEREAALRRIVDVEIAAERERFQSVLTEQQLLDLANARRSAMQGQLDAMREASILSSNDLFAGMAVGFSQLRQQFSLGTAGADAMGDAFSALQSETASFFSSLTDGSISTEDRFKRFAQGLVQAMIGIVAQMLATIAVAALLNVLLGGIPAGAGIISTGVGGLGGLFGASRSGGGGGGGDAAASRSMISPDFASRGGGAQVVNISNTNINAADAASFARMMQRNSVAVAEVVAGEANSNYNLRTALGN